MAKNGGQAEPEIGHNLNDLKKDIQQAMADMDEIDASRLELNERAGEIRARLETKGVNRKVFNAARQFAKTDEDKRKGFDTAYAICREAMGVPIQGDMFEG